MEGLGLTSIEAILAKKPVILNKESGAAQEFLPEFCADANADSMQEKILDIQNNKDKYSDIIESYNKKYSKQFSSEQVVNNIIKVYNDYMEKV